MKLRRAFLIHFEDRNPAQWLLGGQSIAPVGDDGSTRARNLNAGVVIEGPNNVWLNIMSTVNVKISVN